MELEFLETDMKIILIFLIINLLASQNFKKAVYEVELNQVGLTTYFDATLHFNNNESFFETFKVGEKSELSELPDEEKKKFGKINERGRISIQNFVHQNLVLDSTYAYYPMLFKSFLVGENIKKIHWQITTVSKKIGVYNTIKAIGIYRGRKYEAWFAPEIPVPFGPWKLQGLPGLILEAQDEKMFKFKLKEIKLNETLPKNHLQDLKKSLKIISIKQFHKEYEDEINKIISFIKSKQDRENQDGTFTKAGNDSKLEIFDEEDLK